MPGAPQSKYWCFTLNNYTDDHVVCLHCLAETEGVGYLCFGYEVGASGTPHLQGYIEFTRKLRLSGVRKLIYGNPHLELRRGTAEEASMYCKKDGDWEEFGTLSAPEPGRRSDLEAIRESIAGGVEEVAIANTHFSQWVVYRRSFQAYRSLINPPQRRDDLKVYVLWGPAGTGKTSYVHSKHPGVYPVPSPDLQWMDGYNGEDVVLVDDFNGEAPVGVLKRFLDIYPLRVPVKGGFVAFNARTIYITSNHAVPWTYVFTPADEAAINRRITRVVEVTKGPDESIAEVHARIDAALIIQ